MYYFKLKIDFLTDEQIGNILNNSDEDNDDGFLVNIVRLPRQRLSAFG